MWASSVSLWISAVVKFLLEEWKGIKILRHLSYKQGMGYEHQNKITKVHQVN